MRIISPFKDYYDHVAHQYGGGDPKIIYVRSSRQSSLAYLKKTEIHDPEYKLLTLEAMNKIRILYLVVAGRGYVMAGPTTWGTKVNEFKVQSLDWMIPEKCRSRGGWWHKRPMQPVDLYGFIPGEENKDFVELSRTLKTPIFAIERIENQTRDGGDVQFRMTEHSPVLGTLGMGSLVSAEQMYQDLSYFVGNTMHGSPDIKPPVEVSNNDKILAAGFDLRKSFRHRT